MIRQPYKRRLGQAVGDMMRLGRYSPTEIAGACGMPTELLERIIAGDTRSVERATVISLYNYLAALIDVPLISDLRGDAQAALRALDERVAKIENGHPKD